MKKVSKAPVSVAPAVLMAALFVAQSIAQDTHYAPKGQQIQPPVCFTLRGAWEGGYTPCTATTHQEWLADVIHWRSERRIRTGFDPARYEFPAFK